MTEVLATLLRVNLALAIAVAAVMVLRLPVRRLFGARIAYGLWGLPPLTTVAMLVPARVVTVHLPMATTRAMEAVFDPATTPVALPFDIQPLLAGLWLAGALACLAWQAWRQTQFTRATRAGRAGPAVVGVLRPRIVTPADFDDRYTPAERAVVLAHERVHLERGDPSVNAALALLTCANWFNPAVHAMSHWLKIDQELACDARVVAAHPKARKAYAQAMLKTQLAARPLPLGCHWSSHPLAERVRLITRPAPSRGRRLIGAGLTLVLGLTGAVGAWAARPAEISVTYETPSATAESRAAIERTSRALPRSSGPTAPLRPTKPHAPVSRTEADATPPRLIPIAAPLQEPIRPPVVLRPARIIQAVADRSLVQPGSAVRVVASGLAPDGVPLWSDFTAFGSQRFYRKGAYERGGSRYSIFTSVVQEGQRLRVTVSLGRAFRPELTGAIDLAPNQTGVVRLPTGQAMVVSATVRPETPEEVEEGRRMMDEAGNAAGGWG
ncbi:M56 family metallopeptidase [Caulobacter soli]|uniref:M56 family metallopeptidase n=1 Tax=Caulobacter soli TaxID=2708539 RepID=UPI0013EC5C5B|nr:M56 family metallopeptidase [Caulobacter soli]